MSEIETLVSDIKFKDKSEGLYVSSVIGDNIYERCILLSLPCEDTDYYQIMYVNLADEEKEWLFDMLDENLHQTTYDELYNDYISVCRELTELRKKSPKEEEYFDIIP